MDEHPTYGTARRSTGARGRRLRRAPALLAAAVLAGGLGVAGCGEDNTDNGQVAVANAQTADPTATVDRPGRQTDTTAPASERPSTTSSAEPAPGTPKAEGGAKGAAEIVIPADENDLAFVRKTVTASPGAVELTMANPSDTPHNIAVDRPQKAAGAVVGKGGKSTITVAFPAGRYEYYCSVPGHREAGMVGTLIVK